MGKLALVVVVAASACLLGAGRAASNPVWSGQCGIQSQQTVWGEYGWPTLLPILAHRGTLLAITQLKGSHYPADARARGAATYAFDLRLKDKVGTPTAPADPSTVEAAAQTEYQKAVGAAGDGCTTPLVVENELFGATIATPWSAPNAQYRANVLAYLQDLAALGAHPVLLVNKSPYTGSSEAVAWWLSVAKVADIVREVYLPATTIWRLGPILGNRLLRQSYRQAVTDFTSVGIPANRLGIMLSFLSAKGVGGRNGLQPASAWYQVVKWEALAAKEVAGELQLGSVFSWGWQQWNSKERDPAKPKAACVWLWARSKTLCNAPRKLGPHFDRSLTAGQILLPHGTVCSAQGFGAAGARAVASVQALTGDRDAALSAVFERLVESAERPVSRQAVLAAERQVVRDSFHGRRSAYLAALREAHATVGIARGVLGDELRRARLEQQRYAARPTAGEVAAFYQGYPDLLARRVRASPSPPWLGARSRTGFALAEAAPQRVFTLPTGRKARLATLLGTFAVRPLGAAQPLGALPFSTVRPAIVAALRGFERAQSFERWTIARQNFALSRTTCLHDQLPQPAAIDLTQYLPFLRIQ
ncbi:MAG TPA: hypothetical protein VFM43_02655 [Gaiellaceae bacterium]|nr:hypothetical protein [Gaiellaceae bacterium]